MFEREKVIIGEADASLPVNYPLSLNDNSTQWILVNTCVK